MGLRQLCEELCFQNVAGFEIHPYTLLGAAILKGFQQFPTVYLRIGAGLRRMLIDK